MEKATAQMTSAASTTNAGSMPSAMRAICDTGAEGCGGGHGNGAVTIGGGGGGPGEGIGEAGGAAGGPPDAAMVVIDEFLVRPSTSCCEPGTSVSNNAAIETRKHEAAFAARGVVVIGL